LKIDNFYTEMYECTVNISFPRSEVVEKIYDYVKGDAIVFFEDVYNYLRDYYELRSFNRKNLMRLLIDEFNVNASGRVSLKQSSNDKKIIRDNFRSFLELRDSVLNLKYYSSDEPNKSTIDKMLSELRNGLSVETSKIDKENKIIKRAFEQYIKLSVSNNLSAYLNKLNKNMIEEIYSHFLEEERIKSQINSCIQNIHHDYREVLLERVLSPSDFYAFNIPLGTRICDLSNSEIEELGVLSTKNADYASLLSSFDKPAAESLVSAFLNAIKEKSSVEKINILIQRGQGKTLDEIGIQLDVTRERIRQIEKRIVEGFVNSINSKFKLYFFNLLRIMSKNPLFVTYEELNSLMGDYAYALIDILTSKPAIESEIRYLQVYSDISVLNLSKIDWYSEVNKRVNLLDEVMADTDMDAFLRNFKQDLELANIILPEEAYYRVIANRYKTFGKVYSVKNLTILDQYNLVIKKYFKGGIHIYDDESLKEFRRRHFSMFENPEIFEKENRAINARIADVTIQIDRGTYCVEEDTHDLPNEIAMRINNFIMEGPSIILTLRVFNQFEEELAPFGINNRYMLHAMLKRRFGDEFYFKRDFISKKGLGYKVIDEFERYLNQHRGLVSVDTLNTLFPSANAVTVLTYLSNHPEYIPNFNREWINLRDIERSNTEVEALRNIIVTLLKSKEIITAKHVIEEAGLKLNDFFKRNNIEYPFYLFGILRGMFREEFKFERPFIASHDTVITKGPERIKQFIEGFDQITISEITEYNRENDLKLNGILEFIRSISKEYLWVDEDLIMSTKTLDISEDVLSSVKYIVSKLLKEREAINLKKLKMSSLPNMGCPWNKYLMASIIDSFIDEFKVINTTNFYSTTEFIVVKNDNGLDPKLLIERYG